MEKKIDTSASLSINGEHSRTIDYLRLSITDRCNLNCSYCTPIEKGQFLTHDEVLRYEEMVRIVTAFVALGVDKVRITGGEPLIKRNITGLVRMLKQIKGLKELSMTTNGVYLGDIAYQLKEAGLDRVNISIDTLKQDKYISITGKDNLGDVWQGIKSAFEAGLNPVKLNVVVMKGVNDDEVLDFVRLTFNHPLTVRFIEFFPTSKRSQGLLNYAVKSSEIKEKIEEHFGKIDKVTEIAGNGPAQYYKLKESKGLIGFIDSFTGDFCSDCNRMRIDCAGRISPCLFSGCVYDLGRELRSGKDDRELLSEIRKVLGMKSQYNKKILNGRCVEMSSIGG